MSTAWVALGSNLDDPKMQLERAMLALQGIPETVVESRSHLYQSPPWGLSSQPDFINAVVLLHTSLSAQKLLQNLQAIEVGQGRVRGGPRWGPRTIDLDLLMFDHMQIEQQDLVLPHPRMAERAFVLRPLAELSPQLDIPGQGRVDQLLAGLDDKGCHLLAVSPD